MCVSDAYSFIFLLLVFALLFVLRKPEFPRNSRNFRKFLFEPFRDVTINSGERWNGGTVRSTSPMVLSSIGHLGSWPKFRDRLTLYTAIKDPATESAWTRRVFTSRRESMIMIRAIADTFESVI
jgi:hypothetical protein